MPIVQALCLNDAWDSAKCFYYEKGRTYPIDTDSELAHLTARPLSSGKVDQKTGEIVPVKPSRAPLPCFQFDRAAPLGAMGTGVPSDYTCDDCGKKCKSLNELGTHVHKAHPKRPLVDESEEEVVVQELSTCKQCDPPQVFNSRGEMMRHKGEVHGARFFQKGFGKVEAEAIPA
jgi:hypothetical protein